MGAMILQMVGCLLVAAAIGVMMGWLLRSFATSEKRQQLSEIAGRLRGREHELDTLNHELKVRTSAVQMLEGKMMTSEAALKDLTADLAAKVEQLTALQTEVAEKGVRLHAVQRERETLRREVEEAEATLNAKAAGFAEMQAQMENAEDVLISRDQEIATLKTWVEQLAPKDAEIARLRARIEELDPFVERSRRLEREQEQERARASTALRGKEGELAAHQARLMEIDTEFARVRTQSQEDLTRFGETACRNETGKFSSYEPLSKNSTYSVEKSKRRTLPSAKRKSAGSWMSASVKKKSEPSENGWSSIARLSVLGRQQNPQGRSDRLRTARPPPGKVEEKHDRINKTI